MGGVVFKPGLYHLFLTGVVLVFERGEVLFKSGVVFKPILCLEPLKHALFA